MKRFRQWHILPALVVLLAAFAGCEGESPMEPPRPGGGSGGAGGTPPTNASISLAVSNATPLVGSSSTITATVTQSGQTVPNGTAVEFSTNLGAFVETNTNSVIRTTTNGVATAALTSSAAGTATVTVRVNNAAASAQVVFTQQPTEPPPPETAPTITSISPSQGPPAGGNLVTITGTNLEAPVRVTFGGNLATVVSQTPTEVRVIAPAIDLGPTEQAREVTITVITKAGTAGELAATGGPYRYELQILTPNIFDVSPSSGPNEGNTRVVILGEGFQAPAKVFFGAGANRVEAEVQKVTFSQIIALTPPASGLGVGLRNELVPVRVVNVASATEGTLADAFRYGPTMAITAVGPTTGSAVVSNRVTIEGWGFDDPVAVTVGGIGADPIFVSGTKIIVQTGLPAIENCADVEGPISVTNIEDGSSAVAEGVTFVYRAPQPSIIGITPNPVAAGATVSIDVRNAGGGSVRFQIGDTSIVPATTTLINADTWQFTMVVPSNLDFDTETCVTALGVTGEQFVETGFDLAFENRDTGCEDDLANGLIIIPPDTSCRVPPAEAAATPTSITFSDTTAGSSSPPSTVTVSNTGGEPLTVNAVTPPSPEFVISANSCTGAILNPNGSCTFNVSYSPTDVGADSGPVIIDTTVNDPQVAVSGNGI